MLVWHSLGFLLVLHSVSAGKNTKCSDPKVHGEMHEKEMTRYVFTFSMGTLGGIKRCTHTQSIEIRTYKWEHCMGHKQNYLTNLY